MLKPTEATTRDGAGLWSFNLPKDVTVTDEYAPLSPEDEANRTACPPAADPGSGHQGCREAGSRARPGGGRDGNPRAGGGSRDVALRRAQGDGNQAASSTTPSALGLWSRWSRTHRSQKSWSTHPRRCTSSVTASSTCRALRFRDQRSHYSRHRPDNRAAGAARGRVIAIC